MFHLFSFKKRKKEEEGKEVMDHNNGLGDKRESGSCMLGMFLSYMFLLLIKGFPCQASSTATTFGAKLYMPKIRGNKNLTISWRMRSGYSVLSCFIMLLFDLKLRELTQPSILARLQPGLELVPIRPVALLAGCLECKGSELYLLA